MFHVSFIGIEDFLEHVVELDVFGNPFIDSLNEVFAVFIDEGFGTLDDNSIHDAMDVLESVRRSCGMIGIISHVQLLESNIPTHLEVIKSGAGSQIKPV